jgi:hypothetical protein
MYYISDYNALILELVYDISFNLYKTSSVIFLYLASFGPYLGSDFNFQGLATLYVETTFITTFWHTLQLSSL